MNHEAIQEQDLEKAIERATGRKIRNLSVIRKEGCYELRGVTSAFWPKKDAQDVVMARAGKEWRVHNLIEVEAPAELTFACAQTPPPR